MYALGWLVLLAASLGLSLGAFAWALATGQFADQGRARYLALEDGTAPAPARRRAPREVYALAAVAALVGLGLAAPLWLLWAG